MVSVLFRYQRNESLQEAIVGDSDGRVAGTIAR